VEYDNPSCRVYPVGSRTGVRADGRPCHVIWITLFRPDGHWRTVTDVYGLLRTHWVVVDTRTVFASSGHRLHSRYQSQESAAEWCRVERPGAPANIKIIISGTDVPACGVQSPSTLIF